MPVPTSNDAAAYGNDGISVGVPFYIIIDQEQSTQEERDGAIAFITWLLTTPEGQAHWSGPIEEDGMNFILSTTVSQFSQPLTCRRTLLSTLQLESPSPGSTATTQLVCRMFMVQLHRSTTTEFPTVRLSQLSWQQPGRTS